MTEAARVLVLYGSQTFTAQEVAERIWRSLKILGFRGPVTAMDEYPISRLVHEEFVIFVCATTGQGDEPDNMKKFWKFLLRKNLPANSLSRMKYGVLGLGDSSYNKFNFVGKRLQKRLAQLGASPLLDAGLCDYQHDLGHDAVIIPWLKNFYSILKEYYPYIQTENLGTKFVPRWNVSLMKTVPSLSENCINEDIYYSKGTKDNFLEATLLEVERNDRITEESHFQVQKLGAGGFTTTSRPPALGGYRLDVRLMTFTAVGDATLNYVPGDVFNIRPRNSKEDVDDLFDIFQTHNIDIRPHDRLLLEECHEGITIALILSYIKQEIVVNYTANVIN